MMDIGGMIAQAAASGSSLASMLTNIYGYDKVRDPLYGKSLANASAIYGGQVGKISGVSTGKENSLAWGDEYKKLNRFGQASNIAAGINSMVAGSASTIGTLIDQGNADKAKKDAEFKAESSAFLSNPDNKPIGETLKTADFNDVAPNKGLDITDAYLDMSFMMGNGGKGNVTAKAQGGEYLVTFDKEGNMVDYTSVEGNQHASANNGEQVTIGRNGDNSIAVLTRDQLMSIIKNPVNTKSVLDSLPTAGDGLQTYYDKIRNNRFSFQQPINLDQNTEVNKMIREDMQKDLNLPSKITGKVLWKNVGSKLPDKTKPAESASSSIFPNMTEKYKQYERDLLQDKIVSAAALGTNTAFAIGDIMANRFKNVDRLDRMPVSTVPYSVARYMPKDYSEVEKQTATYLKKGQEMGLSMGELSGIMAQSLEATDKLSKGVDVVNAQIQTDTDRINAEISGRNVQNRLTADLETQRLNEGRFMKDLERETAAKQNQRAAGMQLASGPIDTMLWLDEAKKRRLDELQAYYQWLTGSATAKSSGLINATDPQRPK